MEIEATDFDGVLLARSQPAVDDRGSFTRLWCKESLSPNEAAQMNLAVTTHRGTIRGLHFQTGDDWEAKFIRCLRGAMVLVAVDLRTDSATYLQHFQQRLDPSTSVGVQIPIGFAQGYQTLAADTEVLYVMSRPYKPEAGSGFRYDDPAFSIRWPLPPVNVSSRDQNWPAYNDV
ncbi:MAG: dTDP-4-dehydrorhamnose 3,5-epimerase [Aureliella sp.]